MEDEGERPSAAVGLGTWLKATRGVMFVILPAPGLVPHTQHTVTHLALVHRMFKGAALIIPH